MLCTFCTKGREATHRTRRDLAICTPCARDIQRDTLSAPADFRPIRGSSSPARGR